MLFPENSHTVWRGVIGETYNAPTHSSKQKCLSWHCYIYWMNSFQFWCSWYFQGGTCKLIILLGSDKCMGHWGMWSGSGTVPLCSWCPPAQCFGAVCCSGKMQTGQMWDQIPSLNSAGRVSSPTSSLGVHAGANGRNQGFDFFSNNTYLLRHWRKMTRWRRISNWIRNWGGKQQDLSGRWQKFNWTLF